MNTYEYSWKTLDTAVCKNMEARQPFEVTISGWRAGLSCSFLKYFAAVENQKGGFGSAFMGALLGFLLPGLALLAGQSRLSGYEIKYACDNGCTRITMYPSSKT